MTDSEKQEHWDHQLAALLEDLSRIQDDLLDVLAQKQQFMARGDVEAMNGLQQRETALCDALRACQKRRADLLEAAGQHGLPSDSLGSLANALEQGNPAELRKRVNHASARMRLVQHQSLANWVLAQKALIHLSQMLEIIATGGRLQPTYGRESCAVSGGALVDQEV